MAVDAYIPGVCNINLAEIAYRRKVALGAFVVSAVMFLILVLMSTNVFIRAVVLFVPLFVAIINTLQVRNKFCVSYGAKGHQNAEEGSAAAQPVNGGTSRKLDTQKARKMNLQAFLGTIGLLLLSVFIPS